MSAATAERPSLTAWRDNPRAPRRRKYANEPTMLDGMKFDSRAEAKRWAYLAMLQRAGEIDQLQRQVSYELVPKQVRPSGGFERPIAYLADFTYRDKRTGRTVVEDVKGASPDVWIIKRKLMLHVHGIEIREVKA